MDTRGRLLVAAGSAKSDQSNGAGAFHAQLEAKQKYEAENAARIIAMLEPVVGENKVRADVSADLDFSRIEQSEEKYNPQSQVVRSQQTSSESRNARSGQLVAGGAGGDGGIAGARSNNPAIATPAAPPAAVSSGDQRNTSTVNYEIDKTVTKTVGGGGRVNRMTVSVVVDHKAVNEVDVARSSEELRQIQDLVSAAVGINTERGDTVVVQTMPFNKLPAEEGSAAPFLERNKVIVSSVTKYGILLIVAVLILLFAIRPATRALKAAAQRSDGQNLLGDGQSGDRRSLALQPGDSAGNAGEGRPMMTVAELQARMQNDPKAPNVEKVDAIRKQLVEQTLSDTDMVVNTMRGWLAEKA
jgi:flagellar M-ring protein FliF